MQTYNEDVLQTDVKEAVAVIGIASCQPRNLGKVRMQDDQDDYTMEASQKTTAVAWYMQHQPRVLQYEFQ